MIVPRSPDHMTWSAMIRNSNCPADSMTYAARHLSFIHKPPTNWTYGLVTLSSKRRISIVSNFPQRSKYIAKASVNIMNIHSTDNRNTCVLGINIGALHHYRFIGQVINATHEEVDTVISIYRRKVLPKIAKATHQIKELILLNEKRNN